MTTASAGAARRPGRRAARACGVVLLVLAALALLEAARLPDDWQGARLMPAVLALVLALLAAGHWSPGAASEAAWPDVYGWRRVVLLFGLLVLYVVLMPALGFLAATALFTLCLVRALGSWSLGTTAGAAAATALGGHLVFKQWLGMPLP